MVDGYRELATTNRRAILGVTTAQDTHGIQSTRVERRDVHGRRFGVIRMPMVDFSGSNIGVMIATRDFREYQRMETSALRGAITTALVQIVLLFGLVLLTYNGFVLRPLRRLAEKLSAGESVDGYADRSDEVGDLARAVKKATEGRS